MKSSAKAVSPQRRKRKRRLTSRSPRSKPPIRKLKRKRRMKRRLRRLKRRFMMRSVKAAPELESPEPLPSGEGINLVGYLRSEIGLGESLRRAAGALHAADVPFCMLDFKVPVSQGMGDFTWVHMEQKEPSYRINVFHMNADAMEKAHRYFSHSLWHDRYNIGVWHWELPEFPPEHMDAFQYVQELWAPSVFIQNIMQKVSPVPVVHMPHSIQVEADPAKSRDYFGLPPDAFLFFMMFDVQSSTRRKNPHAVVQAFQQAFGRGDPRVGLVLKVNNRHALGMDDFASVDALIAGQPNIYVIDRIMSRTDINSLLLTTDCYVSLHRSEGFGLGMAEAMYLGKPVIGTNWSGNTDFMHADNSCPVGYSIVPVGAAWSSYSPDQLWAEPDVGQAAAYMQQLTEQPEWRQHIAMQGQATIRGQFSPQAAGQRMRQRLRQLGFIP